MKTFEVENKYPVADLDDVGRRLVDLGGTLLEKITQLDCYYAHPARDFATTDEALRMRRVGEANFITYKGPKIDQATKTRREIELPLMEGAAGEAQWATLLDALGFKKVAEVQKRRQRVHVPWQGRTVDGALDEVAEVGTFVELELAVPESEVEAAKACVQSLAAALGLATAERRSYLELLLQGRGQK